MALKFVDGFDSVGGTTSDPDWIKYDASDLDNSAIDYQSTSGRFGGGAMILVDNGGTDNLDITGDFGTDIGFGFWIKCGTAYPGNASLIRIYDNTGLVFVTLFLDEGQLRLTNWDNASHLNMGISPQPLELDTWHWVETRFSISNTVGYARVFVDGVAVIDYFGDTNGNSGGMDGFFRIFASASLNSAQVFIDDLVIYDDVAGGDADPRTSVDFPIGPLKIETIRPDSTGANAGFTSNSTAANWENVDDAVPDDDTSYNSSTSYTAVDSFGYASLTSTSVNAVLGVALNGVARKDGPNTILSQHVAISSGSTANGPQTGHSTAYVRMSQHILTEDPATSTAWTTASLDAVEFGYATSSST